MKYTIWQCGNIRNAVSGRSQIQGEIHEDWSCLISAITPKRLLLQPKVNAFCSRNVGNYLRCMGKKSKNTGGESTIDYIWTWNSKSGSNKNKLSVHPTLQIFRRFNSHYSTCQITSVIMDYSLNMTTCKFTVDSTVIRWWRKILIAVSTLQALAGFKFIIGRHRSITTDLK
jgi:hypothetical protein